MMQSNLSAPSEISGGAVLHPLESAADQSVILQRVQQGALERVLEYECEDVKWHPHTVVST